MCSERGCPSDRKEGRQATVICCAYEKFHRKNMTRSPTSRSAKWRGTRVAAKKPKERAGTSSDAIHDEVDPTVDCYNR